RLRVVEGDHLGGVEVDEAVEEVGRRIDQSEGDERGHVVLGGGRDALADLCPEDPLELLGLQLRGRYGTLELAAPDLLDLPRNVLHPLPQPARSTCGPTPSPTCRQTTAIRSGSRSAAAVARTAARPIPSAPAARFPS